MQHLLWASWQCFGWRICGWDRHDFEPLPLFEEVVCVLMGCLHNAEWIWSPNVCFHNEKVEINVRIDI
jgi:hypothetical protein